VSAGARVPAEAAPLSRSVEDYLKAVYGLTEEGEAATTSGLAVRLALSPAAVTGMVKKLTEAGHLEHIPYRGVRLTAGGRRAALAILRRHRVLETYLITKLGYDWASVHGEAERLEHAASDDLVDRMAAALGEPRYDPHGAPIPSREGEIERPDLRPLADVEVGEPVALRQVGDDDPDRLRYLKALGLLPGTALLVAVKQPFGGPITLFIGGPGGPERVIGAELAATLLVGPVAR
jgi:DtxR family Mn-dependent transcriptional regulator